ncbi:argonaute/piwi family protein [Burkholderia vietnamiensis]|uniref:argonaute/piwi family protein n=1 Tax=Burkholderia vietnamiensis TaxID=60552 RepID=UPI0007566DBF|nr:Piwi domain-containing protein [Burkholderia vietnamiensis]
MNAVTVGSTPSAQVLVGVQPYDETTLESLRSKHRGDYLFKRGGENGDSILAVALKPSLPVIGATEEDVILAESPWLLAPLALETLLQCFVRLQRPILKARHPLRVLSQKPANLFPADAGVPQWLQRRLVLEFDTRTVRDRSDAASVVLACGVRTRNLIDADCATLIAAGVPLVNRYVVTRHPADDPRVQGYLRLAGRVTRIDGPNLYLEDHGDGAAVIKASMAYLEPRRENVIWCAHHLLGRNADRVLAEADNAAAKHLSGPERLAVVKKTFDYLRSQNIELAPGVPLTLGNVVGNDKGSWIFRTETLPKPHLVFDPSGTRIDRWNERGLDAHGPYDQRTFTPKQLRIAVICQLPYEGQVDAFLAKFLDGLPDVKTGYGDRARAPYAKGFIRRYGLEKPKVSTFATKGATAKDYAAACRAAVEDATASGFEWNLAIVQIDKDFKELSDVENPYFTTKALLLKHRVPVQEVTLETMRLADEQLVYVLNNMSVATYAKVGGTPWLLKAQPTVAHELVVGIGSQTFSASRLGEKERVVGLTTVFSSDGKYLLDDRTSAVDYDNYSEELFKSLSRSIESVRIADNWRSTDSVRLIFHVFKQMADEEADAVDKLVQKLGLAQVKFAFLHIVDDHPFALFDEKNIGTKTWGGIFKGVLAPERGLAVNLSGAETLLCFTGGRELKQAKDGLPVPSLLRLHHRSTFRDMTYLTGQAFNFSCHTWRMFTPAPVPITIHYSELMARLLTGLRHVPDWDPDTMLTPISRTRWFL